MSPRFVFVNANFRCFAIGALITSFDRTRGGFDWSERGLQAAGTDLLLPVCPPFLKCSKEHRRCSRASMHVHFDGESLMLTLRNLRRTALVLAVTGATGVMGAALAASSGSSLATVSRGTHLVSGDAVSGALSLSHPIHVTVAMKLRNPDQLRAYNAKPHRPMSSSQLSANHLPTSAQAQAVANFLKNAGFNNVSISRNRM